MPHPIILAPRSGTITTTKTAGPRVGGGRGTEASTRMMSMSGAADSGPAGQSVILAKSVWERFIGVKKVCDKIWQKLQ